jgi:hypothetical protein
VSRTPRRLSASATAAVVLAALVGCTPASSGGDDAGGPVTTPQASIAGEWVVTRTVVSSDDTTNPARAVGANSVRYVLIERDDCDSAVCPGTVSSGATPDARESTELTQIDGGLEYDLTGTLDCLNTATGSVLAVDAFEFRQSATLTVATRAEVSGVDTASTLTGTLSYTDTLTDDAAADGCARTPSTVAVEYTLSAVRAPA